MNINFKSIDLKNWGGHDEVCEIVTVIFCFIQELTAMMEKLELSHEMEAAERVKLEQEIRAKQEEVQRIQSEVEAKDAEARRLQEEFEAAKYEMFFFCFIYKRKIDSCM